MSDPDSQREPTPPHQPPRPQPTVRNTPVQTQLEADALYARRLAEQYNVSSAYETEPYSPRSSSKDQREPRLPRKKKETGLKANEMYDDRERSFIDGP